MVSRSILGIQAPSREYRQYTQQKSSLTKQQKQRKDNTIMKNWLNIDFENKTIIMDRTFEKKAKDTRSDEYSELQRVRKDYPDFRVITRTIRINPHKKTYSGLSYAYMENYILNHGDDAEVQEALSEYRELREIAKCHGKGKGYPVIKQWFLNRYKEIEEFSAAA